jgi:hypothetical protein
MSSRLLSIAAVLVTMLATGSALACSGSLQKDAQQSSSSSAQASAKTATFKN